MFLLRRRENKTLILDRRDLSSRLKHLLGFRPVNLPLYEMAFIHRSASFTLPDGTRINNERLEFLGDAIIDSIVSEYLFSHFPDASEGFMTKTRARIVNRETLNRMGISMKLDSMMVSNLSSQSIPPNLIGNILEAITGAVFIDRGYSRTMRFFIDRVLDKHLDLYELIGSEKDYKSLLLEHCQKNRLKLNYVFKDTLNEKNISQGFEVTLEINDQPVSKGEGTTKKEAEQLASMYAFEHIKSPK